MTPDAPHILVVDDDARIRSLLRKYLARNGHVATEARDAAHARRLLEGLAFDLMVVDVMMPGEDGFAFTKAMRAQTRIPVLLLTARGDAEDRIKGLECGADDYLVKPFEPRELLLRIAAILRRSAEAPQQAAPVVVTLGPCRFDLGRGELWRGEERVRLTTGETALMRLLCKRPNEPIARHDLLTAITDDEEDGEGPQERAIDVQITRLRRKIEPDPRSPRYLQTVRGAGYMLAPD